MKDSVFTVGHAIGLIIGFSITQGLIYQDIIRGFIAAGVMTGICLIVWFTFFIIKKI